MPEITYVDNLAYQGSRSYVVSTNSFMDLLQDIFGFLFVDALQVRHGEPLLYKASFRIVNLAAIFLTFLASSMSYGSRPS